jgi:hypothetical protein
MNKKIDARDFEEIERMILNEVGEALEVFRARDFDRRLRTGIMAGDRTARPSPFLRRIAVPAAAAFLLAVSAAWLLLDSRRPPARDPIDPRDFAAVLSLLPALSQSTSELPPGPAGAAGEPAGGAGFESVLVAARAWMKDEKGKTSASAAGPKAPALSMKEMIKILFRDKVIERVLMSLTYRSKEA